MARTSTSFGCVYLREKRLMTASWRSFSFVVVSLLLFLLQGDFSILVVAAEEPTWRLQAYHLHHHTDSTTSTTAGVLLSEVDLLSDACELDTVITATTAKKGATTADTTQSVVLNQHHFTPLLTPNTVTRARVLSPHKEGDATMPESAASAELRRRDAEPTLLHATGVLDLGVFQAETVEVSKAAVGVAPLTDLDGEDGNDVLPDLTDPSDETEHTFQVNIFLGDFTRVLCLSAAVYASRSDVGHLPAALAVWVPYSVTPACAMRLGPRLRGSTGLAVTADDVLREWPPSTERQCRLNEANRFTFTFKPSQAQARMPGFCAYEKAAGVTNAPTPGTRRQMRCEVLLEVRALTWYGDALREAHGRNTSAVKIAAAVTEVATPARAVVPNSAKVRKAAVENLAQLEGVSSNALYYSFEISGVVTQTPFARSQVEASPSSSISRLAALSRYKGTSWCAAATVGSGFWFSNVTECVEVIREILSDDANIRSQNRALALEYGILVVAALAVTVFAGVLTGRVVKTVRSSRRRQVGGRL